MSHAITTATVAIIIPARSSAPVFLFILSPPPVFCFKKRQRYIFPAG